MKRQKFLTQRGERKAESLLSDHDLMNLIHGAVIEFERDRMHPKTMYINFKDRHIFERIGTPAHYMQKLEDVAYHDLFGMMLIPTPAIKQSSCLLVADPWETKFIDFSNYTLTNKYDRW